MDQILKPSLSFFKALVKYLKATHVEPDRFDSQPEKLSGALGQLFYRLGEYEALRLKGWALMPEEWAQILEGYLVPLGFQLKSTLTLDLPLEGKKIELQKLSPAGNNPSLKEPEIDPHIQEKMVVWFLNGFTTAYSQELLNWSKVSKGGWIFEGKRQEYSKNLTTGWGGLEAREFVHDCNNFLNGITAFSSLLSQKKESEEIGQAITTSAQNLHQLIQKNFPKKDESI